MSNSDWMPGTRQDQLKMANLWVAVLSEVNPNPTPGGGMQTNAAAWGVPVEMVTELDGEAGVCFELLRKVDDPETATKVARAKCKAGFDLLEKLMRDMHRYFYLSKFPETELYRLGLLPHKKDKTPTPKPNKYVAFEIFVYAQDHRLVFEYRIAGSASKSKDPYHGSEIRIWILPLDAPAPANSEAPGWRSFASTATPWEKTFTDANDIGKRLYASMRWENESTGDEGDENDGKGPWSAIQSVIIP